VTQPTTPRIADIVIEALRVGEVPNEGQDAFATGIDAQVASLDRDLQRIADGRGRARFLRGEYGAGKTFFLRFLAARARRQGFAAAYVRVSYPEVPLHKPVALYREACAHLGVAEQVDGALRHILDQWLFKATERVMDPNLGAGLNPGDDGFDDALAREVRTLLGPVADAAPAFAQALSGYAQAALAGETEVARALLQWISGDAKVAATAKRRAHLAGQLSDSDALPMLRGLSTVVHQAGYKGLVIVIDEVERLVRLPRADLRKSGLELVQNWLAALEAGELPRTLLVIAGTTSFFDSPRGVPTVEPLQQRIGQLDDGPFADLDAPQLRLPGFDRARLVRVGQQVRDIYEIVHPAATAGRCEDPFLGKLADEVAGAFGGSVETTPRRYLRELVGVLGRCRQHPEYEPLQHFAFKVAANDPSLSEVERALVEGRKAADVDATMLSEGFDL
jgi:hypothetical protein